MNARFEEILQQKMDRKQFFKHVGAGIVAVVGLGMITRALMPQNQSNQPQSKAATMGYGSSAYGGSKKPQA